MNSKLLLILSLVGFCYNKIAEQDCLFPSNHLNLALNKATK
jgi:hypothetical protein